MATAEQEIVTQESAEPVPTDPVEIDNWIDWKLRRIAQLTEEQVANAKIAEATIKRAQEWRDEQNATLQNSIDFFARQIHMAALGYNFRGKKSRTLPHGTFGHRITTRAGIKVVDKAAALEFAKAHGIPVKEEVQVSALKEYVESSGMLPDGVEPVAEVVEFYVSPAGVK